MVFTLEGGSADFPFTISDYQLTIFPAGTAEADWPKGVGTGPYILQSFKPGVRAIAKRNPNYWKEGRGHFDEVETLSIVDVNARTVALKTGQIDVMDRCELKTVHLLEKAPGIVVFPVTGTMHYTMPMCCDMAPFDNNDVRLALKYAIDREELVNKILRGYGAVGNDYPIASSQRYYAADLPQRKFDPEKAKFHLKKAGLADHVFQLHAADAAFLGAVDTAILNEEKRRNMYVEMQTLVNEDGGVIVPMFAQYVSAASDKLAHNELAGNMGFDGMRLHERWWFKS